MGQFLSLRLAVWALSWLGNSIAIPGVGASLAQLRWDTLSARSYLHPELSGRLAEVVRVVASTALGANLVAECDLADLHGLIAAVQENMDSMLDRYNHDSAPWLV